MPETLKTHVASTGAVLDCPAPGEPLLRKEGVGGVPPTQASTNEGGALLPDKVSFPALPDEMEDTLTCYQHGPPTSAQTDEGGGCGGTNEADPTQMSACTADIS
eukprot:2804726-Rhodomonas_salina.1